MSYRLEVTDREQYVNVRFDGDLTTDNEEQVILDIFAAIVRSGHRKALVDRQAGQLEPSALSNYEEGKFISGLPDIHRFRIAVLFLPEDIEQSSFLEAVALVQGVNWKFFRREEDAVEWLTE